MRGWEDELKSHLCPDPFPGSVISYSVGPGQAIMNSICDYYFVQYFAVFVIDALT